MDDWLQLVVAFLAAVNPAGVALAAAAGARPRPATAATAAAVAAALLLGAAALGDPLLDFLDVAPETFRIAAGIVMVTVAVITLARGRVPGEAPGEGMAAAVFPLALPFLAGAASVIAAVSYGADDGVGKAWTAAAVAVALGAAALLAPIDARTRPIADAVARITAALLVVVAAGLVVEGVRDI